MVGCFIGGLLLGACLGVIIMATIVGGRDD